MSLFKALYSLNIPLLLFGEKKIKRFSVGTKISIVDDIPSGFDEDVTLMSNNRNFEKPDDHLKKTFEIGVRLNTGSYPSVIIQELGAPIGEAKPLTLSNIRLVKRTIQAENNDVRELQIQLREELEHQHTRRMLMALDQRRGEIKCPRYIPLCFAVTTWKEL